MPTPSDPQAVASEGFDAFWQAIGGEAWEQWRARTPRIIGENEAVSSGRERGKLRVVETL